MKILKDDSILEKRLQEVEDFMREKGISLSIISDTIIVNFKGQDKEFVIMDAELENDNITDFPRQFDCERLVLRESI